jgi:hypothetical protein
VENATRFDAKQLKIRIYKKNIQNWWLLEQFAKYTIRYIIWHKIESERLFLFSKIVTIKTLTTENDIAS